MANDFDKWTKLTIKKIDKFFGNFQQEYENNKYKSWLFFSGLVKKLKGEVENPLDVIIKKPGNFYIFSYDSYLYRQKKLPWYDAYPLILVLGIHKTGFIGLNFHWISGVKRALVLKKIILNHNEQFFRDERIINLNYRRLMRELGSGSQRLVKVAIRKYRWDGLRNIRGLKAARIKNIEMIDSIALVSPLYEGITISEAEKWIRENTRSKYGPVKYK